MFYFQLRVSIFTRDGILNRMFERVGKGTKSKAYSISNNEET